MTRIAPASGARDAAPPHAGGRLRHRARPGEEPGPPALGLPPGPRRTSTCSRSSPRCRSGIGHPGMKEPDFLAKLTRAALVNPTNSDVYTTEFAEFVDTFGRVAMPPYLKYAFFVAGGALGVENALKAAMDWKVRRNFARGMKEEKGHQILHFREAFHGRSGYTVSMTNTADPRKYQYFATLRLAARHQSGAALPGGRGGDRARAGGRAAVAGRDQGRVPRAPGRHRRDLHRADPGRGRRQPLPPRVPAWRCGGSRTRTTRCSSSTRCRPASASPAACGRTSTSASSPT